MLQQTSSHSNVHQYTDRLIHQTFLNKIDCKGRQNAFKKYKNGQLKLTVRPFKLPARRMSFMQSAKFEVANQKASGNICRPITLKERRVHKAVLKRAPSRGRDCMDCRPPPPCAIV